MKKISILSLHLGYGGIEKSIVSLANILCKKYEVEIAVSYQLYDECVFSLDKRVKVVYLNSKDITPNRDRLKSSLQGHHYFTFLKEVFYSMKVLRLRKKTMVQYIKDSSSDIIISTRDIFNTWNGKYAKDSTLKIAWEHNHFHGNYKYANKIVKSVSNCDYLVLVTKELESFYHEQLKNYKCKTICISNCIEELPKNPSKLDDHAFISIGRLSKEKGYMDLVKIYDLFQKRNSGWILHIIGDGDERDSLKEFIQSHHLEDKIILHGFLGKDEIDKIMKKSSIYLMTSYTESFGIVLIEAMSYGIPCIAMDSAEGARDIIIDSENGYLIQNRNFGGMIQRMEKLMKDKDLRIEMGKKALSNAKKYTSDIIGKEWYKLMESDHNE